MADIDFIEDPDMSYPNIPFLEPPIIVPSMHDVNIINSQLDQLSVDVNAQNLRNKLEKTKKQRLNTTVRNIEREIALLTKTVAQIHCILLNYLD